MTAFLLGGLPAPPPGDDIPPPRPPAASSPVENPTCCKTGRSGITFVRDIQTAPLAGIDKAGGDARRTFFHLPPAFSHRQPMTWVVWLQRPGKTVGPYLRRLSIPDQVDRSGANVIMVAPQLSRKTGESAAGRFSAPTGFSDFLAEAAAVAETELGIPAGSLPTTAPVLLVAHGESDAVAGDIVSGVHGSLAGLLLLAPLLESPDGLARWLAASPDAGIGCLWSDGGEAGVTRLKAALHRRGQAFLEEIPFGRRPGRVVINRSVSDPDRTPLDGAGDIAPLILFLRPTTAQR